MKQRGFTNIVLIVTVVLVVGVAGYFALFRKSPTLPTLPINQAQQPKNNIQKIPSVSNETANWKAYTSLDHSLEFKYPAHLHIVEGRLGSLSSGMILVESSKPGETGLEIVLGRTEKETEPNRSLWVSAGTMNIGGYPATKWSRSAGETEFIPSTKFYYFITAKNVTITSDQKTSGLSQDDLDGILASFMFLK